MDRDELMRMRQAIAEEYGIALYRQYGEAQAAHFLEVAPTTLKKWRLAGRTRSVNLGRRKVRYLGLHIADMLLGYRHG